MMLMLGFVLTGSLMKGQVISNNGASVNMANGVYVISRDAFNSSGGNIINDGNFNLSGNYTSTAFTSGNGFYRLGGNWMNSGGMFIPGTSTVILNGAFNQTITRSGGEVFHNLSVFNTGLDPLNRIILANNVNVSGTLSMATGNIDPGTSVLFLSNPLANSLNYLSTTGSRILGKFERTLGETNNYLFPLGSAAHYNPANLKPNTISSTGSLLSEFITIVPGNTGLPLADPPVEIGSAFRDGFWRFKANGFSTGNFNINLNATGFTDVVTSVSRIIVRTAGGSWQVDGMHLIADTVRNVVFRDQLVQNISSSGTEFAVGKARPLITRQPRDTIVCENTSPVFRIFATGAPALKYTWYKEPGVLIQNGTHYSGARTPALTIIGAQLSDIGDYYCIVTDRYHESTRSLNAHLTVNKIPVATATPESQPHECSNVTIASILLGESYIVPGTTYLWSRDNPAGIVSPMAMSGTVASIGDVIPGSTFSNTTDNFITVTFTITPVGPAPTFCTGLPITATVTVNPVPKAVPVNNLPAICYGGKTEIILRSPTNMTTGDIHFNYSVVKTGGAMVTGNTTPANDLPREHKIAFNYANNSDSLQSVHYYITPFNTNICPSGSVFDSEVKVHAKPLLDLPSTIITLQALTCEGDAGKAALRANISKGAGPYHIAWTGPFGYRRSDSIDIMRLNTTGKYVAKVTDNLGCFRKDSIDLVGIFAKPFIRAVSINPGGYNISCIGASDGTMQVAVESGITPYYDYWVVKNNVDTLGKGRFLTQRDPLNPSTYRIFNGLSAGQYRMIVSDVNKCISTSAINFRVPQPFNVSFGKSSYNGFGVSCKGYNNGSAWVESITGGRGFYKYRWFTSDGTITGPVNKQRIDNITAGTYYVEVKDTLNCSAVFSVVITEPDGLSLASGTVLSKSPDNIFNISCNGGANGSISMTVLGGIGNNSYLWTGPGGFTATTEDISGLKAGTYTCKVQTGGSLSSCVLTPWPTFTLTEPAPLAISYVTSHSVSGGYEINCNGGTGSVDITVTGGSTGNYTYVWSTANGSGIIPGQADQTALRSGTYHLVVTDLNGCGTSVDITLHEPPAYSLQMVPTHVTCSAPGFRNGSVDLTVTGGEAPYSYSWSNGASTQDISGLPQGSYSVTVSYNNTCVKTDSIRVNLPPSLKFDKQIHSFNSYEISCFGRADGQITVTPTSGKAPFLYYWTGPNGFTASTNDLTGLKAGEYRILITDGNMCTAVDTIQLHEPGPLGMTFAMSASTAGGFNINCAGDSTGLIIVQPINSVNNVEFLWADGFAGRTRSDLPAGTYSVIIRDGNNCQASGSATLTQPDTLKLKYQVSKPFCPAMPDGVISLNITGGVRGTDYSYTWSDNSRANTLTNIPGGQYSVIAEDLNGCTVEQKINVEPENETCLGVPNIISPNGDLVNDYWYIDRKELYPQMEVKIFNRRGRLVWKSEKGYPKPWDGKGNGANLPIDSYHYIIDLHDGSKPILGTITIVK